MSHDKNEHIYPIMAGKIPLIHGFVYLSGVQISTFTSINMHDCLQIIIYYMYAYYTL